MDTALWWIRRDLRLADNQALALALETARQVVPVFVFDPVLLAADNLSQRRLALLVSGLDRLDAGLKQRGGYLVVRRGEPVKQLALLMAETGAEGVYAEEDFSPYARRRDAAVAREMPLVLAGGLVVYPPNGVLKADGSPYTVFTPFCRAWKALPQAGKATLLPPPERMPVPAGIPTHPLPRVEAPPDPMPGEAAAVRRLVEFAGGEEDSPPIYAYAETRDRLDQDGTSRLSAYLRLGMLSARQAVAAASAARGRAAETRAVQGAETWLNELIWREFYISIMAFFPFVGRRAFRENLQSIAWRNDRAEFEAWKRGETGYPVVDAAMRQLASTGWMHNRARMIVASFLVKDLLVDWRWGEAWFMRCLVDGDPAANNGGWQWTAGTGTDAAPYFRVFNPTLQSAKFDPEGIFIRRWLPELARVPAEFIHEPGRMTDGQQKAVGCVLGSDYPAPIVNHKQARQRALEAYRRARQTNSG